MSTGSDPAQAMDDLFRANGWGQRWRNGIFDYQHYHATVHEALGVARGHALVLFGGEHGEAIQLNAGDVAILPAGTGHKCIFASHDFCVVGAYPPGETMQITRPTPENYRRAMETIPHGAAAAERPGVRHGWAVAAAVAGMRCESLCSASCRM